MKMSASNRTIVAMLIVAGLAIAFWLLLLAPRREEASALAGRADQLRASQAESRDQVAEALAAKREFPTDYRRLVVLGQAVPSGEETPSLLVELSSIARRSKVKFEGIQLSSAGEGAAAAPPVTTPAGAATAASAVSSPSGAVPAAATVPPTEAAAALLPLGATVGSAGLGVMPYKLTFSGDFFQIAGFIEGIDSLVHGAGENVGVKGRLITLDGFSLAEGPEEGGSSKLDASFSVTTYLTPPDQGATAGASPSEPAPSTAVPASAESTEPAEPAAESSTNVSNTG
jgi:Tfp pilus assembly protein PilO